MALQQTTGFTHRASFVQIPDPQNQTHYRTPGKSSFHRHLSWYSATLFSATSCSSSAPSPVHPLITVLRSCSSLSKPVKGLWPMVPPSSACRWGFSAFNAAHAFLNPPPPGFHHHHFLTQLSPRSLRLLMADVPTKCFDPVPQETLGSLDPLFLWLCSFWEAMQYFACLAGPSPFLKTASRDITFPSSSAFQVRGWQPHFMCFVFYLCRDGYMNLWDSNQRHAENAGVGSLSPLPFLT